MRRDENPPHFLLALDRVRVNVVSRFAGMAKSAVVRMKVILLGIFKEDELAIQAKSLRANIPIEIEPKRTSANFPRLKMEFENVRTSRNTQHTHTAPQVHNLKSLSFPHCSTRSAGIDRISVHSFFLQRWRTCC